MDVCDIPLDKISREDFEPFLTEMFAVSLGPGEATIAELTLEASYIGGANEPQKRQPFLLIFSGLPDIILPQHIYTLANPQFGSLSLFLVPLQPDAKGSRYQAVFN